MSKKTQKQQYVKKDPIDHCLSRSDMYVGSKRFRKSEEYISEYINHSYVIKKKSINSCPAILRIFVEALSNSIDNVERSKDSKTPCTKIKVSIDKETGLTTVWNNGKIVPIEKNVQENCYNHSMIFGQMLTGSNYNDEEERMVSGRNGLGIKLCNIFSKEFTVKGSDPENRKTLKQKWSNNMKNTDGPKVKTQDIKSGYTEVSWIPDFSQFKISGYSDDIINLYRKFVIDAAMLTKITVVFNNDVIKCNNLISYSKFYENKSSENIQFKSKDSDVLVTPSNGSDFEAISFVNGVYTKLGGQHVDMWSEEIFRPIVNKINKKGKPQINIKDVKQFFRIFVSSTLPNPEFDSQDKNKLENPSVITFVKTQDISKILKWTVISNIEEIIRGKEMIILKKKEKSKTAIVKIEGLDPANNAGTRFSKDCTLILCEGLSAKTYAVAGIEKGVYGKQGRDWFGVYPLRGKVLNVRNNTPTVISKNNVITDLIQALSLRNSVDYTNEQHFNTLKYGKVLLLTDSDVDGIHIEGLLINFFHALFPSLLERDVPFLVSMKTPIVRVFKAKQDLLFYDENNFRKFAKSQTTKMKAKYYKGLGTTRPEDVPDTFGLKMLEYVRDEEAHNNINKVFNKNFSDIRKSWIGNYNNNDYTSLDDKSEISDMLISDFINSEMIKFSIDDCKRSLPNLYDGLKESQRKILYACFKRKLKYSGTSLKVAQLGGYVAEHTNYHHGEQNLFETIIKMANEFPGSNNIPLLYRDGMFGSRSLGGKDAASARYIYTKFDMLTHLIYRPEDFPIMEHNIDDGDVVEPKFYIPIIPMILCNGCNAGIGTGWSCNVPSYNPLELIDCIYHWIDNGHTSFIEDIENNNEKICIIPEIKPWYRDFNGEIEEISDGKYITKGIISDDNKNNKVVSELPIGLWTDKFKETCEELLISKKIKGLKNYSTPKKPHFVIKECNDNMKCSINNLKLYTYVYNTNMVLFTEDSKISKYDNIYQIIDRFCKTRFEYYIKRKVHILKNLKNELSIISNKARFIREIIDKKLDIMFIEESEIIKKLEDSKYDKVNENEKESYDYLLRMHIRTFSKEKVLELEKEMNNLSEHIIKIQKTSEEELWKKELEELKTEYKKFLTKIK